MLQRSKFWWEAKDAKVHEHVFEHVRALEEDQRGIAEQNLQHARLYANCDVAGLNWTTKKRDHGRRRETYRVTENVVQSVVDTAASMIAKNRPRPVFMTDEGQHSDQQKAKLLGQFIEGVFAGAGVYEEAVKVFRDACVFGTGILYVHERHNRIQVERVIPDEIIVDESACRSAPPREIHRRMFVDREVLKARYPKKHAEIDASHRSTNRYTTYRKVPDEQVVVLLSWHLPSAPGAKDGRFAVTVEGGTLHVEQWKRDNFPLVTYRWSEPLCGWYGQGLAEQLAGIQLRINKLNKFIARAQDLIATPRVFVDVQSRTMKLHINNEIGAIIPYRGKTPVFHTPQAVGAEIYQYKEDLKRSAFEFAGISQLSAQSKKPGGLESAVALREFNDIETQRFAIQAQRFEHMFIDLARQMVLLAKEIHGRGHKFESVFMAKKWVHRIDWKEVDLEDEDRFIVKVEASSIVSRTPAGRLQSVIEMAQSGLIDTEEARRLLDHPDLKRSMTLANAAIEDIEATIEHLLAGEFHPPEPFQDLELGIKRMQLAELKAHREGAPENILELLRRWMDQAEYLLQEAANANAEAPASGAPSPDIGPVGGPPPAAAPTPALAAAAAGGAPLPFS